MANVNLYTNDFGSHRFVLYDEQGEPISAIQVMRRKFRGHQEAVVEQIYTRATQRRKGHATFLFRLAQTFFPYLIHSEPDECSDDGLFWIDSLHRVRVVP